MYGIAGSLDELRARFDAHFSTIDSFCKFDGMSRHQEGASLSISVDLFDQFPFLYDREVPRRRDRMG